MSKGKTNNPRHQAKEFLKTKSMKFYTSKDLIQLNVKHRIE